MGAATRVVIVCVCVLALGSVSLVAAGVSFPRPGTTCIGEAAPAGFGDHADVSRGDEGVREPTMVDAEEVQFVVDARSDKSFGATVPT